MGYRVGVDIGGTFTDIVVLDDRGRMRTEKVPSTPSDYANGIENGLTALLEYALGGDPDDGSTDRVPKGSIEQIQVGSDTRESVAEKVGVPASSGVLNDSGYYYVRMRTRSIG